MAPNHANDNFPSTREAARESSSIYFFTGEACARGHISRRYTSTGQCATCQYEHRISWREANPEKEAESRLKSVRAWAKRNPDRKRELARKSNAKPEVSANNVARAKRWALANPERAHEVRLVSDRNRKAALRGADGSHTVDDVAAILKRQKLKCAECSISIRSQEDRHVDHIMPLSKGGTNWPSNLQVLCATCNLRKAAKDPLDFAKERGRLV